MLRQFWLLNGCRVKNADIFCGLDKNHKITEIIENIPLKEYNITADHILSGFKKKGWIAYRIYEVDMEEISEVLK